MQIKKRNQCNLLVLSVLVSVLCSCAQMAKKEQANVVDEVTAQNTEKAITERMDQLVRDATAKGEQAVQFLASDLFIKAADAGLRGDSKAAAYILKFVYDLKPNDSYVAKKYAVELIRSGQLNEANIILEKLHKDLPKDTTISLILAGVATALDDANSAQKIYKEILVYEPSNEEACVFLSKSLALRKEYKKAVSLLNKCEKGQKNAIFSYYKGKIAVTEKNFHQAAVYFKEALKIDPEYYQAVNALGIYYEEKGDYKKVDKLYRDFLDKNPSSYSVLSRYVNFLFDRGRISEVIPFAERLSSVDPSDLNLKVRLGVLYTDVKKYDEAIGVFKEILDAVPNSDKVLYYLGSLYQQTGKYESAVEFFNKIESSSPLFVESSLQVAHILNILAMKDHHVGSQVSFNRLQDYVKERSKEKSELNVEMNLVLAGFYENVSELDKAIATVEAVRGKEQYSEGHDYYLAALYEKNNQFLKARTVIESVLSANPNNPHALNFLGYSLLERGIELDKAFAYISKAVELKPDDGYIRDSLGWYYFKTGNLKKAYSEIKKAKELVKDDPVITKHLAMVYKEMKNYAKAKSLYVEALKICKEDSEKAEVIKELEVLETMRMPASVR